ncbi:hypothetical protein MIND_00018400 [Mycena indigotica]|uniref:DUF6699 domain-containing protein n=1 Tax=Mycena indigotica TaxID=2126181 RepID=A0A8H6TE67_9AGAR|nr:uncharacterized protein MIND_00018400 [Mycena indigotica]KAF7315042.1 hypothetical protein MIND_00018400 [Mycena indigotica]
MSGPFRYNPHEEHHTPTIGYNWGFPFRETIYPNSPYNSPIDPGTPNTPERPLFSGLNGDPPRRQRRNSWHVVESAIPFIPPAPTSPLSPHLAPWDVTEPPVIPSCLPPPGFPSFVPPTTPSVSSYSYVPAFNPYPTSFHIHPWLNGEMRNELSFDLSLTDFAPHRAVGPEQFIPLSALDIHQPAFYPAITRLHIVCDAIPNWPIDIVFKGGSGAPPPISLGDILIEVHKKMHQAISHREWDELSFDQEQAVTRAFTKRCKIDAQFRRAAGWDHHDLTTRKQGVKVVDFLNGRTMFRGLVRNGDGSVRMIVSE